MGPNAGGIHRMLVGGHAQGPVAGQAERGSPGRQPPGVSRAGVRIRRRSVVLRLSAGIGKNSPGLATQRTGLSGGLTGSGLTAHQLWRPAQLTWQGREWGQRGAHGLWRPEKLTA